MKRLTMALLGIAAALAGCKSPQETHFEHGDVHLAVRGRVIPRAVTARDWPVPQLAARTGEAYYALDKPPTQVNIEARLLETSRRDTELLGIQWLLGGKELIGPTSVKNTTAKLPPIALGMGFGMSSGGSDRINGQHPPGCTCPQCRGRSGIGRRDDGGGISASPKIGLGLPLGSDRDDGMTSLDATFTLPELTPSFLNDSQIVIILRAVERSDRTRVLTQPVILSVTSRAPTITPPTKPATEPLATRSLSTTVTAPDGTTIVLAGLVDDREKAADKVPFLNDIPLLNRLFRHKSDVKTKRELLIFVTPRIVLQEEAE